MEQAPKDSSFKAQMEEKKAKIKAQMEEKKAKIKAQLEEKKTEYKAKVEEKKTEYKAHLDKLPDLPSNPFDSTPSDPTAQFWIEGTKLTFKELAESLGFKCEQHQATTEDGYHLNLFRVQDPKFAGQKQAVAFLQHGLLSCSNCWIKKGHIETPGFLLAQHGYDVWFGNSRGGLYSHSHTQLDPVADAKKFQDFSFQDLGKYDVPAQIDKAREVSGQDKVTYIGHSQGTTQMFYALAKDQKLIMSKVNLFVALAPVAYLTNVGPALKKGSTYLSKAMETAEQNKLYSVFNTSGVNPETSGLVKEKVNSLVKSFTSTLGESQDLKESSTKMLWHYGQMIAAGRFQEYDNGDGKVPAEILMENITDMPIALFVGGKDPLATTQDVFDLNNKLGNVIEFDLQDEFGHSGFLEPWDWTPAYKEKFLSVVDSHTLYDNETSGGIKGGLKSLSSKISNFKLF